MEAAIVSLYLLYSNENISTAFPMMQAKLNELQSQIPDVRSLVFLFLDSWKRSLHTPNGQQIVRLQVLYRHHQEWRLLVHTRSRVYYLRRNKLRLWRER